MIVDPEKMISPSKDPWPLLRRAPAAGLPRRDLWYIDLEKSAFQSRVGFNVEFTGSRPKRRVDPKLTGTNPPVGSEGPYMEK